MDFKTAILFASALVNILLGLVVWVRGALDQVRRVFVAFSIATSFWAFGLAMFFLSGDQQNALFWAKFLYCAGSMIAVSLSYFSFIFPSIYPRKIFMTIVQVILAIFTIGVLYLTLATNQVLIGTIEGEHKGLVFGWGYQIWLFHFLLLMVIAFVNLFIQHRRSVKNQKLQVRFILIGTLSAAIFGSFTNVILPTLGIFNYFSIGPLLSISMVGFIAYAIVKHRLMDIRMVVARAIAYSLLVTIIGIFYVGATFVLSSMLLGSTNLRNQLLLYTVLTIIVAFSFERLRRIVENLTDKIFFKGRYDSSQLLSSLGFIMSTTLELGSLTSQIIQELIKQTRISKGAFVILGEGQNLIYEVIDIGFAHKLIITYNQVSPFFPFHKTIVLDELEENQLKNLMRELDVAIIKTLIVKGQAVGLLLLGEKASGEIYSEQDLKVLEILAPEMAIAIQNSQSYDKIKKFNVILSNEVKKATTELQGANQRLRELDQLKDEFVSLASHELRTPMTVIRSYAWMVLHRSGIPLPQNVQKYAVRILISTERLINLVNEMLNISRIESGRIEINPEPVDLISLCKDIIDEVYSSKSTEKNIQFSLLEQALPKIFVDPEKLRQVLLNIIGNALKFSPADSKITVGFFTDGNLLGTYIKDEGPGISKEDMPKLFTKFGRLDSSYTAAAVSGGTGLGLYISKSLVELMHGRIWAQSEGMGKGTVFAVSVPVANEEILKNAEKYIVKAKSGAKGLEPVAV